MVGSQDYEVSSLGRVRRIKTGRLLSLATAKGYHKSYPMVWVKRRGKKSATAFVHHLVAEAFLGERPARAYIDHKDSDPKNNRADNLEYVTPKENQRRSNRSKLEIAVGRILRKLDARSLALCNALVPLLAEASKSWKSFGISRVRCGYLDGFDELVSSVGTVDVTSLVRYFLHIEKAGEKWSALSLPPSGRGRK